MKTIDKFDAFVDRIQRLPEAEGFTAVSITATSLDDFPYREITSHCCLIGRNEEPKATGKLRHSLSCLVGMATDREVNLIAGMIDAVFPDIRERVIAEKTRFDQEEN